MSTTSDNYCVAPENDFLKALGCLTSVLQLENITEFWVGRTHCNPLKATDRTRDLPYSDKVIRVLCLQKVRNLTDPPLLVPHTALWLTNLPAILRDVMFGGHHVKDGYCFITLVFQTSILRKFHDISSK